MMTRPELETTPVKSDAPKGAQPSVSKGHDSLYGFDDSFAGVLKKFWRAPPVRAEYLDLIAVGVARLFFLVMTAGYVWAWLTNVHYQTLSRMVLFSVLMVIVLVCASPRLKIGSKTRLNMMCVVMLVVAESVLLNNGHPWTAMIAVNPIAVLTIFVFGGRTGILIAVALHFAFLGQSLALGAVSIEEAARAGFVASIWSLMVAGFVMLLLDLIASNAERINALLVKERRTYDTLTGELREPTALLSQFIRSFDGAVEEKETLQGVENVLLGVVEHLESARVFEPLTRPSQMLPFTLEGLARQLKRQMAGNLERWGLELITDVADSSSAVVLGDRFRVRTILANLIRSSSLLSDGTRIWLNVRSDVVDEHQLACVFEVESNGHAVSAVEIEQILNNEVMDNADAGFARSGLELARSWAHQLHGELQYFSSPRGGNGFRLMLNLELETSGPA